MQKNILVTGAPRSGTTYIGKILEKTNSYVYFHEPFRDNHGIKGINHRFPYSQSFNYDKKVDEFFAGCSKFIIKKHAKNKIWEYPIKKLLGNRDQIKYRAYFRNTFLSKNLLLKDPTASFLSDYVFTKGYAKVIVVVRHPMAFYYSLKQKRSNIDFTSFLEQKELVETYLKNEEELIKNASDLSYEQRIALGWKCIYKVLTAMGNEHRDKNGWIVVKHEDICASPATSFKTLCDQLEIQFSMEVQQFINETSYNTGKVVAHKNMLHDFKRDSSALKDYWKQVVTEEQINIIHDITSDVSIFYYDENSWQL
jgi:hypothetical protein